MLINDNVIQRYLTNNLPADVTRNVLVKRAVDLEHLEEIMLCKLEHQAVQRTLGDRLVHLKQGANVEGTVGCSGRRGGQHAPRLHAAAAAAEVAAAATAAAPNTYYPSARVVLG